MLIKCVTDITQSSKTTWFFCFSLLDWKIMIFVSWFKSLKWFKSINCWFNSALKPAFLRYEFLIMLNAKRQKTNYFLTKRYVLRHCRYAISPRDIFRSLRIFHIIFLSFKSTKITVDSKTLKTSNHRCRSRQNFGDAKDFYPNSPKLARKKTPKKSSPCHFGRHFFKSKHVGRHFCSYIRDFVKFSEILSGSCGIFTKSSFWGWACTPCTPASYTSASNVTLFGSEGNLTISSDELSVLGFFSATDRIFLKWPKNVMMVRMAKNID